MAVKIADTLKALSNTFPVAECVDIDVNINGETKRLQKAIDDGEIGGGSDSSWKGTKEEWESLSPEEKGKYVVIYFTDDYDGGGSGSSLIKTEIDDTSVSDKTTYSSTKIEKKILDEYSTDETVIGTWIDGKPIYRKVFTLDVSSGNGNHIEINSLNVEQLTLIKGIFNDTQFNYMFPVPAYANDDTGFYISYGIESATLYYQPGEKYGVNGKLIVIIEYTKTTDV